MSDVPNFAEVIAASIRKRGRPKLSDSLKFYREIKTYIGQLERGRLSWKGRPPGITESSKLLMEAYRAKPASMTPHEFVRQYFRIEHGREPTGVELASIMQRIRRNKKKI